MPDKKTIYGVELGDTITVEPEVAELRDLGSVIRIGCQWELGGCSGAAFVGLDEAGMRDLIHVLTSMLEESQAVCGSRKTS